MALILDHTVRLKTKTEVAVELRTCRSAYHLDTGTLPDDTVHVWQVSIRSSASELPHLNSLLSEEERRRADRFRFEKDRNQFATARGLLRALLASYLATEPAKIGFQFSEKGKPSLSRPETTGLEFNVAHSGDLILLAFSQGRRVGVDVEMIRRDFAVGEIAERFFSEFERSSLSALPVSSRHEAFFRCWTRKEAYIKATGDGLSLALDQFDVTLGPAEPARLLATRPVAAEAERWHLYNIAVEPAYAAALAAEKTAPNQSANLP